MVLMRQDIFGEDGAEQEQLDTNLELSRHDVTLYVRPVQLQRLQLAMAELRAALCTSSNGRLFFSLKWSLASRDVNLICQRVCLCVYYCVPHGRAGVAQRGALGNVAIGRKGKHNTILNQTSTVKNAQ